MSDLSRLDWCFLVVVLAVTVWIGICVVPAPNEHRTRTAANA